MLRPGERIGDWIVETRLGERDRGAVFLARHSLNLNLRGALKVAQPADYEEARASFVAEVEPLLTLQHEALIRLLGWGEDYERRMLWMTTELLRGQSLEERLSEGRPFDSEEVGFVFGRLAGVLGLIHSHGSHHGDLRPTDVLIAESRQIRLTGFGTVFRDGKQGRVDPESLAYVGPEYFDDPDSCSPVAADIYSLGLILYEALTGRRVFPLEPSLKAAPQVARLMGLKLRMGPLDPGDDVPLPLRRIVLQATDPDPASRPGDLSSFLAALGLASRLRTGEPPIEAPAPSAVPSVVDSVRLHNSVLGREQLQTPFPFAPPGWGPRGHQPPPPLANLRSPQVPAEVPDAGRVLEVHKVEQRHAGTDPLSLGPVEAGTPFGEPYGEPEVLAVVDEPPAPPPLHGAFEGLAALGQGGVVPAPLAPSAETSPVAPPPIGGSFGREDEASDDAVLVEPPGALLPDWAPTDSAEGDAPEPIAIDVDVERRRGARAFVPPPPVPDPSDVGLTGRPTIIPEVLRWELPVEEAFEAPDLPMSRYDTPQPRAREAAPREEMPLPVAPPAAEGEDEQVSWFDRYEDIPEAVPAPVLSPERVVPAVAPAAARVPETPPTPKAPVVAPAPPVPEPTTDRVTPTWLGDGERELPEEDDWSWHEEPSPDGDGAERGVAEPRVDPYTRPPSDDYEDALDPSASEIAADVFGDHPERAAWVKRGLIAAFVLLVGGGLAYWVHVRSGEPVGSAAHRVEVPPGPVIHPEVPEPPAPEDALPPPVTGAQTTPAEPLLDLQAVVAAPGAGPTPAGSPSAPAPRDARAPTSLAPVAVSVPPAPSGPWITTPQTEVGTPAPSAAALPPAAPAGGLMSHLREGWSALDSGNLLGAQASFLAALKDDSGNGMAHYGLGQVAERARDYPSAEYHYGRAYQVLGSNPSMRGELEAALRRVGAKSSARTAPTAPTPAPGAATAPAATPDVQVTRKKRDELEESFHDEVWDDDPDE